MLCFQGEEESLMSLNFGFIWYVINQIDLMLQNDVLVEDWAIKEGNCIYGGQVLAIAWI